MKFSSEAFNSKTGKNVRSFDLDLKNEFFYNNAYTIIKSNHLFNEKNYLDILETIDSNNGANGRKIIKESQDNSHHETFKLKKKLLKEKFKSQNFCKNDAESNNYKKFKISPDIKKKDNRKFLKLKKFKIISQNESNQDAKIRNSKSQSTIRNLKSFKMINTLNNEKNQKSFTITNENKFITTAISSPDKRQFNQTNYTTQSPENFSNTRSSKDLHYNSNKDSSKKIINGKYFLDELNHIKEKYLHKFEEKYLSNNPSSSLKNRVNNFQENEDKISQDKNQLNTHMIFKNFISDVMKKYMKEKKLVENVEPDPISIKLRILDNLEHAIPEYSKVITKLKRSLTNMEKRKVIVNFNNLEISEKLDDLISLNKSKLNWDFSYIKKNCLPHEFQKKLMKSEMLLDNLRNKYRKSINNEDDKFFSGLKENVIKPKFKSIGKAKILVVPKEMKNVPEIYEDHKAIQLKEIRNRLKEVLSPHTTNLKMKNFYDELALPKFKSSGDRDIPKDKILSDYKIFEKSNVNLVNQIKRIKNKFKTKSLYIDPKSAFIS